MKLGQESPTHDRDILPTDDELRGLPPYDDESLDDETCPHCRDDGMDPTCDYLLPCPVCQGEQTP